MATITPTPVTPKTRFAHGTVLWTWASVSENDDCERVESPGGSDKSVQVTGTFGGGSVSVQGSLDGNNYETLKDLDGNDITLSQSGIVTIRENVRYVKPAQPSGTSVSINILLLTKAV